MINWLKKKKLLLGAVAIIAAVGIWYARQAGSSTGEDTPMFVVQKGNLQINVLQGGEIRALKNFEVKSEIELPTKIISLINEGFRITEKDIKEGKVLVELDGSDIKDKIITHEIEFQTTVANYIDADEARAIQLSDNQSLARDAEQALRFALMDFERYMGKEVAHNVLKSRHMPENIAALEEKTGQMNAERANAKHLPTTTEELVGQREEKDPLSEKSDKDETPENSDKLVVESEEAQPSIDFLPYLLNDKLGDGEAEQKLRQVSNELLLHKSEQAVAQQSLDASQQLFAKKFIPKTTLENDKVNFDKAVLAVQTAETQLDLFKKYEFPKQAQVYLSAYEEALKKLQRTLRANRSRMAQSESKFQTAKRRYLVELERKEALERQAAACVVKATEPGLVSYGSKDANSQYRVEQIEEGASVRFRQTILTIPNMDEMGVRVNIHESQVKKVRLGQACRITVDAEPGKSLSGVVAELAVLPDSTSSRYTPNLKVYPATIHIDGIHDWLKPGMNAKVEIAVNELDDVIMVPVQSIEVENDHYFTYTRTGSKLERREVKTGGFNDEFIEIKSGLNSGDQVALSLPKRSLLELPEPIPARKKGKGAAPAAKKEGLAAR